MSSFILKCIFTFCLFEASTFSDCFSHEKGGAIDIYDSDTVHIKYSTVMESRATDGAALHANKAKMLMSDCNFSKNVAEYSCGAILLEIAPIVSKYCILDNNLAKNRVGALQLDETAAICETIHFINNNLKINRFSIE